MLSLPETFECRFPFYQQMVFNNTTVAKLRHRADRMSIAIKGMDITTMLIILFVHHFEDGGFENNFIIRLLYVDNKLHTSSC